MGIGIGTSTPVQKLHVAGDITMDAERTYKINHVDVLSATSLGDSVLHANVETVGNLETPTVTGDVNLGTNTLVISDGRVGIGTSSPSHALDVESDLNVTGDYRVNGELYDWEVAVAVDGYIPSQFGDPSDMFPENTADTTTITGLSGSGKWYGGVLAPNGKIYGIPISRLIGQSLPLLPAGCFWR